MEAEPDQCDIRTSTSSRSPTIPSTRKPLRLGTALLVLAAASSHARAAPDPAAIDGPAATPLLAIEPMTTIGASGSGYFSDPYPVRLTDPGTTRIQAFSGTTRALMACAYPIVPRCFSWTPGTVDVGSLGGAIAAAGATLTNIQNLNAFQDEAGKWHAVVAIGVRSREHPHHWTVLVHAHPTNTGGAPLAWAADTILSGSFTDPVAGNYDGKYLEEGGKLYLLFVKNFVPKPALRNGIVIQPMLSPTQPAPVAPVTLLTPGDRYGALASERYGNTKAKLVEAPFIIRISGKYALIYSTGAYQEVGYKAGVAWSDTLLPPPGGRYRKVLQQDVAGIWGRPGAYEVHYLVQSQLPNWPDFTGNQVISPGVASAVRGPDGALRLFFAGFAPDDRPLVAPGVAQADHRRPFFLGLRAAVPPDKSVATVSDAELADWLQPALR